MLFIHFFMLTDFALHAVLRYTFDDAQLNVPHHSVTVGNIRVKCLSKKRDRGYERSFLEVTCGNETRSVQHFWYNTWPDHGVPTQSGKMFCKLESHLPGRLLLLLWCCFGFRVAVAVAVAVVAPHTTFKGVCTFLRRVRAFFVAAGRI